MKRIILLLIPLFLIIAIKADSIDDDRDTFGKTFFHPRSQGSNTAIQSSNLPRYLIQDPNCFYNGIFIASPVYSNSFDRDAIGKFLFFNGTSTMTTGTAAGPGVDIYGLNFLLNDNYDGAITAQPSAKWAYVDLAAWGEWNIRCHGMYCFIHAPIIWTEWQVDFEESRLSSGTLIGADELGNAAASPAPVDSMEQAWKGQSTFFDVKEFMNFARIDGKKSKTGVADVETALGYVIVNNDYNFFALDLRAIFPTGNRPDGIFVFEPIIGNGHQFELGVGTIANLELWNDRGDKCLSLFINGALFHAFRAKHNRTLDLCTNGVGSRYLLFKRFDSDGNYANEIVRGPNILTLDCSVDNAIHGDFTLMLDLILRQWTLDIGYNIWGRSRDNITESSIGNIPPRTFGVAGLSGTGINANATASDTTITGENASNLDPGGPVFISNADLNIDSAEHPGAVSHSLFAYGSYTWGCSLQPFIGLGLQLEFSGSNNNAFRRYTVYGRAGLALF